MDMLIQDQIVDLLEEERYFEASGLLEKYLRIEGKDEFYYLAASDVRLGMGMDDSVVTLLEEAMENGLDMPLVWERMADALINLEEFEEARQWLEKALDSTETEDELRDFFNLGRCCLALLEYDKAASYFEDILLEEDNEEATFLLGMAYGGAGNTRRMRENFDRIFDDEELQQRILEYLTFQDDLEALVDYCGRAGLDEIRLQLQLSRFCYSHEDYRQAAWHLEEASLMEDSPLLMATAILLYVHSGCQADARRLFRLLMADTTDVADAEAYACTRLEPLETLGYARRTLQRHVREILENTRWHPDARIRCAEFSLANDMPQDAYRLLEGKPESLSQQQEKDWFNTRIAACLQIERYQEAYSCLKAREGEKDRTYRKNLAIASFCTGHSPEALSESLAILPDGIGAIIAFLIYDERGDKESAAGILQRMHESLAREEPIDDLSNFIGFLEEMAGDPA